MCALRRNRLTETMNIMAPLSLESSLQAFVKAGCPTGTNLKPGGGLESSVTCREWLVTRVS